VKLAEALKNCASFQRFCGYAAREPTALVRFRRELVENSLE
jgi:IS5 family transposase